MTRPRLLAVSHDYSLTGAPIALLNAFHGLKTNYDILVVSPMDGPFRQTLHDAGINGQLAPNCLHDAQVVAQLLVGFDILLANTLNSCVPIHAAHQMRKPSLWYLHEGHFGLQFIKNWGEVMTQAFQLTQAVATPCQFAADLYAPWLKSTPVHVVPHGITNRDMPPAPRPDERTHVLLLGSFEHRKGQDVALSAMRLLNDDRFVLHFVGAVLDPNFRHQVASHFADLTNVRYWSAVPREQTPTIIADCDVLIVPSRDEVAPLVILEAMSLGKPVIGSRICGIPEMIEDGKTGFLFESENYQQLANLLRMIRSEPEKCRQIGLRGRDFQRQHCTPPQCAERFDKILRQMLQASGAAVAPAPPIG